MADSVQVAVFEGGKLSVYAQGERSKEVVLALPLSRLLAKVVSIPAENRDDPVAYATPILQAMSPFPDEPLTVSCETVRETADSLVAIAAALPEGSADDIGEALDAEGVFPTRIDVIALGAIRSLWGEIAVGSVDARRIVLLKDVDCISLFVLDGDAPVAVRALSDSSDIKREVLLSLLEAEDFAGSKPVFEIVASEGIDTAGLETFGKVRILASNGDAARGVAERSLEAGTLNALPDSWREMLEETRFKAKMRRGLCVAGGIWALIMLVLFGVPVVYGFMTDHQKNMSQEHSRKYRAVEEMRDKVRLVQKYSDHERGALEILKAVSDAMPDGIVELNSWNFKRDTGVRFSGEAEDAASVYEFKDALLACASMTYYEDDPDNVTTNTVFSDVLLTGPSASKGGRQKFDIDCRFGSEEEEN